MTGDLMREITRAAGGKVIAAGVVAFAATALSVVVTQGVQAERQVQIDRTNAEQDVRISKFEDTLTEVRLTLTDVGADVRWIRQRLQERK